MSGQTKRSKEDLPTNDEISNEQCAACLQITDTLFMSGGEMASSSPAHRHNSTECRCWYYLALLHIFLRYTLQFTVHYNTLRECAKYNNLNFKIPTETKNW